MDDECRETLIEIAKAIEDRSPVVFMPIVAKYLREVAQMVESRDALIAELQDKLKNYK